MPSGGGYAFGPFQLDLGAKRLLRGREPVPLAPQHADLLGVLVSRAGEVITKDDLVKAVWRDVIVGNNSVEKAVVVLRRTLDADNPTRYIETSRRAGYRFVVPVTPLDATRVDADIDARLAPHRALIEGRAALETLSRAQIARARATFEDLLLHHPDDAMFHVGLANACVLQFEATRADARPDLAALTLALAHAHEAIRLNARYAEAWATLGFILERTGKRLDAVAALHHAITLEDNNWRHWIRLSAASWGEERLRAARRTLELLPGCPLARVLIATVYVARRAFGEAERELDAGIAEMAAEPQASARLSAVALYLLKGLLCLARGDADAALAWFKQELALEAEGHLYARECAANTWCAIGACHLGRGESSAAAAAFAEAIARIPHHPMAHTGLALLAPSEERPSAPDPSAPMDVVIAYAALIGADSETSGAAAIIAAALDAAPPGNAAWLIPLEPLLGVHRAPDAWAGVLARLRRRAM